MAFLDEIGLQILWSNTKNWFGKYLNVVPEATKVSIELKSGQKAEKDSAILDTKDILSATQSNAGVMSAADKKKLDGIATGATANIGTISQITTTSPLLGSGTSGSIALSHKVSGVTSGTYGVTANATLAPNFGASFVVPGLQVDSTGHVVAAGQHNVTIPKATATQSTSGLMSFTDKIKLDGLSAPPVAYVDLPKDIGIDASSGTSSSYAKGDHIHKISIDTGDNNGQVKIAGTNVSVKGLGSAAYTASTDYATADQGTLAANAIPASQKGAKSGVAELDATGKVPSSQLPSYVDDVLEYDKLSSFPTQGETGKIYVATDTNKTYRWGGSKYVEIATGIALGETQATAYRGDRGATAYTHATSDTGKALTSGLYKITTSSRGHVTAGTAVTKSDITKLGIPESDTNTHVFTFIPCIYKNIILQPHELVFQTTFSIEEYPGDYVIFALFLANGLSSEQEIGGSGFSAINISGFELFGFEYSFDLEHIYTPSGSTLSECNETIKINSNSVVLFGADLNAETLTYLGCSESASFSPISSIQTSKIAEICV